MLRALRISALLLSAVSLAAETYFIPAAAHAEGAYGTRWRTQAAFVNPGTDDVCAELYFLPAGRDNGGAQAHPLFVPGGQAVLADDLVGVFFASPGKAGAVRVKADGPLVITTRTFNDLGEAGTYGQGIPGVCVLGTEPFAGSTLPGPLLSNASYRTNLGFVNASNARRSFDVELSWSAGRESAWWSFDLRPYEYIQLNDPLRWTAGAAVEDGEAVITPTFGTGPVLAWASVVDNRTGDPTYYPALEWKTFMAPDPAPGIEAAGMVWDDVAHAAWIDDIGSSIVLGETVVDGSGTDVWLRWEGRVKRLSGPRDDKGFSVRVDQSGGALLAGGTVSSQMEWDAWFTYLFQDGFPTWNLVLGSPEGEWPYAAWPMEDGSMRFCGQTDADGTGLGDAWVGALDFETGVRWQYRYGGPGQDWAYAMVPLPDGAMLAAGALQRPGGDLDGWLLALDVEGNILWQKAFGGERDDMFYGLALTADGNFVAAGQTRSWGSGGWGGWDGWVVKVASDGTPLWQTVLGTPDTDLLFSVDAVGDGVILAGQRGQYNYWLGQAWVVRLDAQGSLLWQVEAGGMGDERLYGVKAASDGRLTAVGRTSSMGAGNKDALILALEPDGSPGAACEFLKESEAVPLMVTPEVHPAAALRAAAAAVPLDRRLDWMTVDTVETEICDPLGEPAYTWVVPAAAHVDGVNGTQWRTDLALRNHTQSLNRVELRYFEAGPTDGAPRLSTVELQSGVLVLLEDIVGGVFGAEGTHGGIEVRAGLQASVSSRTYTASPNGTYGQAIAAMRGSEALRRREKAVLAGLVRNGGYRTNVGMTSCSDSAMAIRFDAFRGDGSSLGSLAVELGPREHRQIDDFLGRFSSGDLMDAWVAVSSETQGAAYFAYASVADNRTGDPVYIPAVRLGSNDWPSAAPQ